MAPHLGMPSARRLAHLVRVTALAVTTLALAASAVRAQERTLSWPRIDVTARIDADGRLHVVERQVMRFTGAWNGGERRFDTSPTQRFAFEGLAAIDTLTGARVPMREGSLDEVGGWKEAEGVVRWRSRRPDDPPFAGTRLVHELSFSYGDILVPQDDGGYLLDHDFGFADRDGTIDTLTITLTVDPAWRTPAGFTGRWQAFGVPPGQGFGVDVPLVRVAPGVPASVRIGAPAGARWGVFALLLAGMAAIVARWLRHDARMGRFAAGPGPEAVTPDFLEQEVFAHLPEVVGAAWDGETAQAEVAATLARLVQERKLASRVELSRGLLSKSAELHLELLVDLDTLRPHEQRLVQGLFGDARTTSTSAIRARYKTTGFDPASLIRSGVAALVDRAVPAQAVATPGFGERWGVPLVLVAATIGFTVPAVMTGGVADLLVVLVGTCASVFFAIGAGVTAAVWRRRATGFATPGGWLVFWLLVPVAVFGVVLVQRGVARPTTWALLAIAAWWLAVTWATAYLARTREAPARIRWRRRLAAARSFFREELREREPALSDAWYPYLLAFGLGRHVDRWFAAFGGDVVRDTGIATGVGRTSVGGPRSDSSSSGPSFTGFGGGGGFSGGGGGAEFGAAVGAFAATVSAPSSSSSGGSRSSSSSSSGGGGGGGW